MSTSTSTSPSPQPKTSWWSSMFPSTQPTAQVKTDIMKLDECNAKLPVDQKVVGGRRRRSAKKSTNKRRRPAKKSLFNITKKWNPFAK